MGALGAQLRPKRGRPASRGLPRAARGPGAPPRPLRRRPARSAIALEEIRLRQERQRQLEEKQRKLEELRKSEE